MCGKVLTKGLIDIFHWISKYRNTSSLFNMLFKKIKLLNTRCGTLLAFFFVSLLHIEIYSLTFNILQTFNEYEKVQCLIRKDPRSSGTSSTASETQKSRATPVVDETVQYLTPYTSTSTVSTTKRKKGGQEVPMEKRLKNLQLNRY